MSCRFAVPAVAVLLLLLAAQGTHARELKDQREDLANLANSFFQTVVDGALQAKGYPSAEEIEERKIKIILAALQLFLDKLNEFNDRIVDRLPGLDEATAASLFDPSAPVEGVDDTFADVVVDALRMVDGEYRRQRPRAGSLSAITPRQLTVYRYHAV